MWLFWWIVFIAGLVYALELVHEYIVFAVLLAAGVGWQIIKFWAEQDEGEED